LINYELFNEESKSVSLKQLSSRFHSTDSWYALEIEENKFTELSRLRVVPQLKYKNHQFLMNSLADGITDDVKLSNQYDHFFQEGESNIQIQKEMAGKPILFGEKIQLYHEATQRYLKAIPIDSSKGPADSKERYLTFKLGFSKYPNKFTHFTFSPLYNTNMQTGKKTISDRDKVYLSFVDDNIEYNLVVGEEDFLFKTGIKQDMEVRKLSNPFGWEENELTQKLKYVYIRHGQGHNFIKPVFDDKFAQFKLQEIRQDEITETSGLKVDFVWKWIVHDDLKVSFVHMKSGILLSFDNALDWADTNGERCKKRYAEVQRMINEESWAFKINPIKQEESIYNTLIKGADFKLQLNVNGQDCFVKSSIEKYNPDEEKIDEEKYINPPQLKNQELFQEVFGQIGSSKTVFTSNATVSASSAAIFSVVKLENAWKQEIEFSQTLSTVVWEYFDRIVNKIEHNPLSQANEENLNTILFDENVKLFSIMIKYLVNEPHDKLKPGFVSGRVVRLR
jgi:hypothetical protein